MRRKVPVKGGRGSLLDDEEPDRFLLAKVAIDSNDAGGQEAGLLEQGGVRTGVDVQVSVRGQAVQQPERAGMDRDGGGEKTGVERRRVESRRSVRVLARLLQVRHDFVDVARFGGSGDHRRHACTGRQPRSYDLGAHPARSQSGPGR